AAEAEHFLEVVAHEDDAARALAMERQEQLLERRARGLVHRAERLRPPEHARGAGGARGGARPAAPPRRTAPTGTALPRRPDPCERGVPAPSRGALRGARRRPA